MDKPIRKMSFLALLKTLISQSKNHSFLSKISKKHFFWLDYSKKTKWKEITFLEKNYGLSLYENMYFLARFKTWIFWSKIILFYPEYQKKKVFSDLNTPKKPKWEKVWYLEKNHRLSPFENLAVLHFLKLFFFWSQNHSFLSRILKNNIFWLEISKKLN